MTDEGDEDTEEVMLDDPNAGEVKGIWTGSFLEGGEVATCSFLASFSVSLFRSIRTIGCFLLLEDEPPEEEEVLEDDPEVPKIMKI